MVPLGAHLGGGVDRQAAPQAQLLAGEIERVERGVLQHEQIPLRVHQGADRPDHLARVADVDAAVHHHHELRVGELGQGAPEGHRCPFRLAGIGLVDGDHGQLVAEPLHRQEEVDDLRDLLAQDRCVDPVQCDGEHRVLLRRASAEGGEVERIAPLGHALEPHQR